VNNNPLGAKFGRYFATRGWAHLVLLSGVGLFLFPFLWMMGLSMKTDEEATTTDLFPTIPVFRSDSPVVRGNEAIPKPTKIESSDWKALLPQLKQWTRAKLDVVPLPPGGQFVDANALRDSAAINLIGDSIDKLKEDAWTEPIVTLKSDYDALLTPDALAAAMDTQLGRLTFRGLQVRTLDAKIHKIFDGTDCVTRWHVDSGNAKLVPGVDDAILKYHFDSDNDAPIVLSTWFNFPGDPTQLHKVMIAMNNDDSWHRIDAELTIRGDQWTSTLTTYIAQYRAGSVVLQPPTFDDSTYQPKTYVPMAHTGTIEYAAPRTGEPNFDTKLTLTIRPSGTGRAIFGKLFRNYQRAFRSVPFWTYMANSTLLVVLQMAGALFSSAFVAYAFARLNWPGRSLAFGLLLSTMMLPSQVTMIPSFVIWKSLGWYNTLNPLWVPAWFGSAFFIFLMTQHMKTIPKELEEAARIDGLNAIQTWWYIILPLVKPTLAAIAIMVFMGAWNDFMFRDQSKFPLSLGLFGMKVDNNLDFTLVMAGNMLMTVPVIIIFFAFQRYFIEGVTVTGMKG
jgi:multiple sugar transport system permease protein